jgi:hypothetical protein
MEIRVPFELCILESMLHPKNPVVPRQFISSQVATYYLFWDWE